MKRDCCTRSVLKAVVARLRPAATLSLVGLAQPWVVGCEDPLKEAQRIEEPRVLGVRVATLRDEASLAPGETARFEVLLADEQGPFDARVAYKLCAAAQSVRGVPYCEGEALSEGRVEHATDAIELTLPESLSPSAAFAFLGVACGQGEPQLKGDPLAWGCSGSEAGMRFSFDTWASGSEFTNQNPDLSTLRVRIGDVDIALDEVGASASCADDTPEVAVNTTYEVEITLGAGAREAADGGQSPAVEALQLSHFSTGGLFERQFSFVTAEQRPEVQLTWQAPSRSDAVKQYLVVRDGRGGVTWVSWSVCAR